MDLSKYRIARRPLPDMTALTRSPLALRIFLVLLFPLYALTANFFELALLLILGLVLSKIISAALGRKFEGSAYEGTSVVLVFVYINCSIACLIFRNPFLRLFATFFMPYSALSRFYPIGREGYWATHERRRGKAEVGESAMIVFGALIGTSLAYWRGVVDGGGYVLLLLPQLGILFLLLGLACSYAVTAWLWFTHKENISKIE